MRSHLCPIWRHCGEEAMAVRIVTDTSCDLPPQLDEELRHLGVVIIPFSFRFGLEECWDKSMTMQEFLARAKAAWPTTSVPATGVFAQVFHTAIEAGDQVVCITITGNHSATYSTAQSASQQFAAGQVTVVDSRSLSVGQGLLVLAAARAAAAGANPAEIMGLIDDLRSRLYLYIMVDTVEYLVRGGRASRVAGLMASLLHIRPILTLLDGELTLLDRARGKKSAQQKLIDLAKSRLPAEVLTVAHISSEPEGKALLAELARQSGYPEEEILLTETGMVIATHGGPGTLGIAVVSAAPAAA
jgi:DegV family protein with EDD domain